MGFVSKIFDDVIPNEVKPVLPALVSAVPGAGPLAGAAVGAGLGYANNDGDIGDALIGAGTGYLAGGGGAPIAKAVGGTPAVTNAIGGALRGAGIGGYGGNLEGALTGAALGGVGGYAGTKLAKSPFFKDFVQGGGPTFSHHARPDPALANVPTFTGSGSVGVGAGVGAGAGGAGAASVPAAPTNFLSGGISKALGAGKDFLQGVGLMQPDSASWTNPDTGQVVTSTLGSGGGSSLSGSGLLSGVGQGLVGAGLQGLMGRGASAYSDYRAYQDQNEIQDQLLEAQGKARDVLQPYADLGTENTQRIDETIESMPGYTETIAQEVESGELGGNFTEEDFREDPGYQFQVEQGNQALQRRLAAMGLGQSGRAVKEAIRLNQGYADQEYEDAFSRNLMEEQNRYGILGEQQARELGLMQDQQALGAGAAGGIADTFVNEGNIGAGGTVGRTNAISRILSNLFRPQYDEYGRLIYV